MALDIVYGYQGKDHVKASQLGRLLAGTFGGGRYVLDTQNGLAAEMQTANKVRIGTGDLVMDNRYLTNEEYQDLTVESGQSGYNRNDLVCAKYERAAGDDPDHSVEDVDFIVLKGTPTTGAASDPSYTAGDISAYDSVAIMPLWRLPIEGLTVGKPVQLFEKLPPYSDFRDSVSQVNTWDNGVIHAQRLGRVVIVYMEYISTTLVSGYEYNLSTLPEGFRPPAERRVPAFVSDAPRACSAIYRPDGTGTFFVGGDCGGEGKHAMALWAWMA